ncbi:hypothetical protein [Desulfogranum japonicum]|uniref:hypothetical protein n=1 Tax=Desulfogranum japonicum TaxID=231447 RepID=UPI0003FDE38E|nr:hypothetical protein [Desulfogranum japonicum]
MKQHARKIIILLLCTGIGTGLFFYWNSDSSIIAKNIKTMAEIASKEGEENGIAMLAAASKISAYFDTYCDIDASPYDLPRRYHKKDVSDQIFIIRQSTPVMLVRVDNLAISVQDKQAVATGTLRVEDLQGEAQLVNEQALQLGMKKRDGDWLIDEVTFLEGSVQ